MDETDVAFAGIARQARMIADGDISSRELVSSYLERIERLDGELNSIRTTWPERALLEADQADARRRAGDSRPLLGVPLLVKDNLDVAGDPTYDGTAAAGKQPAARDCELVAVLRAAGAVMLGKTLTPELCMWDFTETPTFGVTRNPWDTARTPGGSSGGSGAAVAAGLAGAALGTDGAGSIRIPSAWCGLFGLKPQRGRVPLAPYEDHWHGLTSAGVLARSVSDSALFHDAIAAACASADGDRSGEWVAATERDPSRLRIAVASNMPPGLWAPLHRDNRAALDETAALFSELGHEVTRTRMDWGAPPETAAVMPRYLRGIADDARALPAPDLLASRSRAMARMGGLFGDGVVAWARRYEERWRARLAPFWERHDVLMTPVTAVPPPRVGWAHGRGAVRTLLVAGGQVGYCPPHNVSGQPACAVPAGVDEAGLPRAVQLIGRPWQEATLLQLAAQLERARPWTARRP